MRSLCEDALQGQLSTAAGREGGREGGSSKNSSVFQPGKLGKGNSLQGRGCVHGLAEEAQQGSKEAGIWVKEEIKSAACLPPT